MRKLFLFISFSLLQSPACAAQPDSLPTYRNLVFEGGGVRGIAYAGALTALEQRGTLKTIERVGGTSVGAITALLVALNYSAAEMKTVLDDLNIGQFNDGRLFFVGGFSRMGRTYGWYRGERFERWLEGLIARKTGDPRLTFAQLHQRLPGQPFRDLYVTGTNLTTQRAVVFSHEQTPDMALATAVRISMSVPLYFGAVLLDTTNQVVTRPKRGQAYQVLVDGGIANNYPLDLFDVNGKPNPQTLGLKLERPEQIGQFQTDTDIAPYQIRSLGDYTAAFYNFVIENLNRRWPMADEQRRTIYISTEGITPRVRRMSATDKAKLFESGKRAVVGFNSALPKPAPH
ncbi:MAG: patatin [Cytophagales bacterium]|nr:MAG: patatin [Cytophagales bacterium]